MYRNECIKMCVCVMGLACGLFEQLKSILKGLFNMLSP